MTKEIIICEECQKIFSVDESIADENWGHKCKAKDFKKEHRCESYLGLYKRIN